MSMVSARWQALRDALEHCARNVSLYRGIAGPDPELPVDGFTTSVVTSVPVEASGKFRLCQTLHVDVAGLLARAS